MRLSPPAHSSDSSQILDAFLDWLHSRGLTLYDHQEEAILELFEGRNVILNTPTGSGKSLVALALQFRCLCLGEVSYYTVPIKALANEKFLALCEIFGPDQVGLITGDATVNPSAPIICCTAEILSNLALREGKHAKVDAAILDEFHYYSDHSRGIAWQIPLLSLPQTRFLLMSATLGDTAFFQKEIQQRTGIDCLLVQSDQRPVPLEFSYSEETLEEKVGELVQEGKSPIYLVHFTQLACAKSAQNLLSQSFCSKEEKQAIQSALVDVAFNSPYGKEVSKFLRNGIGIHHAGLLPKYRLIVEKLTQQGLLKVICGTDTLGVGINVPIRAVLFTQLCKYDGKGTGILSVRDFKQICGRAGRRGFDEVGFVVAQAPEHVVENLKLEAKSDASGKKKKFVKKKPPEKGFVSWDANTFQLLQESPPEPLKSSFQLSHSLLLQVLSRTQEDGCCVLKQLIAECHEPESRKKHLRAQARKLFFDLLRGKILEIIPLNERDSPAKLRLHWNLQEDFTMNQALALYLIDTLPLLDAEGPMYPLQVISLVEAILENPQLILRAQVQKAKDALVAEMKEDGSSYEERMEALLEVDWPKPGADFIYDTFNAFIRQHPWIEESNIRPKSIAREMFEDYSSFEDYIKNYSLEKCEALLLRHLTEVYKVLNQTVPPQAKSEGLLEAEAYFEDILRRVDSSLLEEWQRLHDPSKPPTAGQATAPTRHVPLTRRTQEFRRQLRLRVFELVKCLARDQVADWLALVAPLDPDGSAWTQSRLDARVDAFYQVNQSVRLDPEARHPKHCHIDEQDRRWRVEQVILDADEQNDWVIRVEINLDQCDAADQVVLQLIDLAPI